MFNVIIVTLNPQDHKYCGQCRFNRNARACTRQCFLFHRKIPDCQCRAEAERLPECIEAERRATALRVTADPESVLRSDISKEARALLERAMWAAAETDDEGFRAEIESFLQSNSAVSRR